MTGATAAMIALTTITHIVVQRDRLLAGINIDYQIWSMTLTSTCATLLVMSVLQVNLNQLWKALAEKEAQARGDARTDALTGLGNRKFLLEKLAERSNHDSSVEQFALLFIDLNNFKRVNDTLGHAAGDELIIKVALRLGSVESDAAIARLGGDEFAIILDVPDNRQLEIRCKDIVTALAATYTIGVTEVYVGVSVGAVIFKTGLSASDLMRCADVAMYKAKSGQTGYRIFDQELIESVERRGLLEVRLREALRSGHGLSAVFQPQVTPDGGMIALEALLRWNDEQFGSIPADEVVSIAEESGLIADVGLFMANVACEAARQHPHRQICLNVAPLQMLDEQFAVQLKNLVDGAGLNPAQFQIDIAEVVLVERSTEIRPAMLSLIAAGFSLAADDVGTSTSSLSHLANLGVTTIKLDRSLLQGAVQQGNISVMRAIVSLAKTLHLSVVCEGVSNAVEEETAIQAGCDYLQGFRYGKPARLCDFLLAHQGGPEGALRQRLA